MVRRLKQTKAMSKFKVDISPLLSKKDFDAWFSEEPTLTRRTGAISKAAQLAGGSGALELWDGPHSGFGGSATAEVSDADKFAKICKRRFGVELQIED